MAVDWALVRAYMAREPAPLTVTVTRYGRKPKVLEAGSAMHATVAAHRYMVRNPEAMFAVTRRRGGGATGALLRLADGNFASVDPRAGTIDGAPAVIVATHLTAETPIAYHVAASRKDGLALAWRLGAERVEAECVTVSLPTAELGTLPLSDSLLDELVRDTDGSLEHRNAAAERAAARVEQLAQDLDEARQDERSARELD